MASKVRVIAAICAVSSQHPDLVADAVVGGDVGGRCRPG
jgi:hypothetical protein